MRHSKARPILEEVHVFRSNAINLARRFLSDVSAATAIEYGLIAAGISVAIIMAVQGLGSGLNSTFTSVATALK